jgi:hypothetical protein
MKPRVRQKLDQILSYPFFKSVGQPLPDSVFQLNSWKIAAKECSKLKWENFTLHARNAIQNGITSQYPKPGMWERLQEWNPLTDELRPILVSFAEQLTSQLPLSDELKKEVKGSVSWDTMGMCLECEFSDILKPAFFTNILDPFYAAGHFPCGRKGRNPLKNYLDFYVGEKITVF